MSLTAYIIIGLIIVSGVLFYLYQNEKKKVEAIKFAKEASKKKEKIRQLKEKEGESSENFKKAFNDYKSTRDKHKPTLRKLGLLEEKSK